MDRELLWLMDIGLDALQELLRRRRATEAALEAALEVVLGAEPAADNMAREPSAAGSAPRDRRRRRIGARMAAAPDRGARQ